MKFLRFVVFVFVCFVILWAMVACASKPIPGFLDDLKNAKRNPKYYGDSDVPCESKDRVPDNSVCVNGTFYVPYVKRFKSEIRNVMLEGNCTIILRGLDDFLIEGNHILPKNGRCKISAMQLPKPETAYPFPVTPVPCGNVQIGGSNNQASANCGALPGEPTQ